jgi:glycerol-3-phosphate dehydrogenase (NAD(P)+)
MSEAIQSGIVLGAGSWGTALAALLAMRGVNVQFWGRDQTLMQEIGRTGRNERYLPSLTLPEGIHCTSDLAALTAADVTLAVVPSKGFHAVMEQAAASGDPARFGILVSCTKGIELNTGRRMSELMLAAFPQSTVAVLSGPNHAEEVSQKLPTAAVVACAEESCGKRLQQLLTLPWFRSYRSTDVVGVEWAGALKNVYAIASGIAEGLKLGDNAVAALVTRALAEMTRLGCAMGGQAETFQGLSGVGDLVATCFSSHSRNHRVGQALGQGQSLSQIVASSSMVAEGVGNTLSLHQCARSAEVRTPLLDAVHGVLYEDCRPQVAIQQLFARDAGRETE